MKAPIESPSLIQQYTAKSNVREKVFGKVEIERLTPVDRAAVERLRHDVYATELGQHAENEFCRLTDDIDLHNITLVAKRDQKLIGFITITPSSAPRFSLEKYFPIGEFPVQRNADLYEVRLLTLSRSARRARLAGHLMCAALYQVKAMAGKRIIIMGRTALQAFYQSLGFQAIGHSIKSGQVQFELMMATVEEIEAAVARRFGSWFQKYSKDYQRLIQTTNCFHGGASWEIYGTDYANLTAKDEVIAADVLDAWFDPAPQICKELESHHTWLHKTSPPTHAEGLCKKIAEVRGINKSNLVIGAGSSDLIYRHWASRIKRGDRVLLLDPMYGEYQHILKRVLQRPYDCFELSENDGFAWQRAKLAQQLEAGYDHVVWVHPNNPTGTTLPKDELCELIDAAPKQTQFWVDEAYVDYLGSDASLEQEVAYRTNLTICKSMSKMYALSGLRVAYAVMSPELARQARQWSPPWLLSNTAQWAAMLALEAEDNYYRKQWQKTHKLRRSMLADMSELKGRVQILASGANFVVVRWIDRKVNLDEMLARLRGQGILLRDLRSLSDHLAHGCFRVAVTPRYPEILSGIAGV